MSEWLNISDAATSVYKPKNCTEIAKDRTDVFLKTKQFSGFATKKISTGWVKICFLKIGFAFLTQKEICYFF